MRAAWAIVASALAVHVVAAQAWWFEPYGRLDVSIVTPGSLDSDSPDPRADRARLSTGSRNRVGVVGEHESAGAWRVRARLEQSLLGLNGERLFDDARWRELEPFDALAVVSISHYASGRLDIGRRTSILNDLANTVHPWAGETVGADRCASILRWPCPHNLDRPWGVAFETPIYFGRISFAGQLTLRKGRSVASGHAIHSAGAQRVDVGLRSAGADDRAVMLGVIHPTGPLRLHALWTQGRRPADEGARGLAAKYAFLGATRGWRGGEARIGVGRYRQRDDDHVHWSAGYHYPLDRSVIVYTDVAAHRGRSGTSDAQLDVGVKVRF